MLVLFFCSSWLMSPVLVSSFIDVKFYPLIKSYVVPCSTFKIDKMILKLFKHTFCSLNFLPQNENAIRTYTSKNWSAWKKIMEDYGWSWKKILNKSSTFFRTTVKYCYYDKTLIRRKSIDVMLFGHPAACSCLHVTSFVIVTFIPAGRE